MLHFSKKFQVVAIVGVLTMALASSAFAEEKSGNGFTDFFKRLFNYPGKAASETAGTTSKTLHNTGEKVVAKTGENTSAVLSGDLSRTGSLVVDPVTGAAETTGQTVS